MKEVLLNFQIGIGWDRGTVRLWGDHCWGLWDNDTKNDHCKMWVLLWWSFMWHVAVTSSLLSCYLMDKCV